jgi:hypothetical protein
MDHQMDNFFADDITSKKSSAIDGFSSLKNASMDFLSNERNERTEKHDDEKPKEAVDDFLNFHDDVGEMNPQPETPVKVSSVEKKDDDDNEEDEVNPTQTEAEIDFHAIEDDYLNPYSSPALSKGAAEPQNEKFISSEDLLTDFKDPHPAPAVEAEKVEPVKVVEAPKPEKFVEAPKPVVSVAVEKQPPVSEPVKPVVVQEPPKPKTAPPPAPVKPQTSADTQIEAEKIFIRSGLG